MKKVIYYFVAVLMCSLLEVHAQHSFSGNVIDEESQPLAGVQLILLRNDSLFAATATNDKGRFAINKLPSATYMVQISSIGFSSLEQTLVIQEDREDEFVLARSEVSLDEVVIKADRSQQVKRTATGEIFYLSEEAKNRGSAFRALQDIPKILSNDALRSITMEDGSVPLILIDGIAQNSGVAPINPKDIESVEVVDIVSAKYLKSGVKNIINITLKEKTDPFLFFETATRHDIPIRDGFGVVYFEVGNPKVSLYGRASYNYLHHDKMIITDWQRGENYSKESNKKMYSNGDNYLGELLFKWRPTQKDFLIAHIYGTGKNRSAKTKGSGLYQTTSKDDFTINSRNNTDDYIFTGSLYHKHLFSSKSVLETTLAYNRNGDKMKSELNETYADRVYTDFYRYNNNRTSASLDVDYTTSWGIHSLNLGSSTGYIKDRINKITGNEPVFHHRQWNQYLYADFSSKVGKLSYLLSLGIEGIWLKAGKVSNRYIKPRVALSGTYQLDEHNSFRMGYTLTNQAPPIGQLNPYNTSIDSLVITRGNPQLLPSQSHQLKGTYTFNHSGFYLTPSVSYMKYTDRIEPYGETVNDIFISSYKNSGIFSQLEIGGSASYRFKTGRVYSNAYHHVDYLPGLTAKKGFSWGMGIQLNQKKWTFVVDFYQQNARYTAISTTKQMHPFIHLQLIYNFTKDMYLSVAYPIVLPAKNEIFTESGVYRSFNRQEKTYYPWILFRYTLRKNLKRKIDVGNVVRSKESGISL